MMRVTGCAVLLALCLAPLQAADLIKSHLGNAGPAFAPGMTPATLGWGRVDKPYPDKFVVNPKDGAEMAWVPAGEFDMGSTPEEQAYALGWGRKAIGDVQKASDFAGESPIHHVRITKGFWLYRHEVTNLQYRKLKPEHNSGEFRGDSLNGDGVPVVNVSWEDARAYCVASGVRLPTEAEWEYSCRAGTKTKFWWGDSETEAGQYANVADKALRAKHPDLRFHDRPWTIFDTDDGCPIVARVGAFRPNAFGLHDMVGNVWEWCADWYEEGYYAKSPEVDPPGPASGTERVLRGGSWGSDPSLCRSAIRTRNDPGSRLWLGGFRCARTP